tara:strand:+ start:366 stop:1214 length:849 start_codon:yes stop_codon:yes gene_type:complete
MLKNFKGQLSLTYNQLANILFAVGVVLAAIGLSVLHNQWLITVMLIAGAVWVVSKSSAFKSKGDDESDRSYLALLVIGVIKIVVFALITQKLFLYALGLHNYEYVPSLKSVESYQYDVVKISNEFKFALNSHEASQQEYLKKEQEMLSLLDSLYSASYNNENSYDMSLQLRPLYDEVIKKSEEYVSYIASTVDYLKSSDVDAQRASAFSLLFTLRVSDIAKYDFAKYEFVDSLSANYKFVLPLLFIGFLILAASCFMAFVNMIALLKEDLHQEENKHLQHIV